MLLSGFGTRPFTARRFLRRLCRCPLPDDLPVLRASADLPLILLDGIGKDDRRGVVKRVVKEGWLTF